MAAIIDRKRSTDRKDYKKECKRKKVTDVNEFEHLLDDRYDEGDAGWLTALGKRYTALWQERMQLDDDLNSNFLLFQDVGHHLWQSKAAFGKYTESMTDERKEILQNARMLSMKMDRILKTRTGGIFRYHCMGTFTSPGCGIPCKASECNQWTQQGYRICASCWEVREEEGFDSDEEHEVNPNYIGNE